MASATVMKTISSFAMAFCRTLAVTSKNSNSGSL